VSRVSRRAGRALGAPRRALASVAFHSIINVFFGQAEAGCGAPAAPLSITAQDSAWSSSASHAAARRSAPSTTVVVADSRDRRDGRFIERVGFYNPVAAAHEEGLRISQDRVAHWKARGAQMSDTVAMLVKRAGRTAAAAPAAEPAPAA
jgi:small subunit ribosomal protein S16